MQSFTDGGIDIIDDLLRSNTLIFSSRHRANSLITSKSACSGLVFFVVGFGLFDSGCLTVTCFGRCDSTDISLLVLAFELADDDPIFIFYFTVRAYEFRFVLLSFFISLSFFPSLFFIGFWFCCCCSLMRLHQFFLLSFSLSRYLTPLYSLFFNSYDAIYYHKCPHTSRRILIK